MNQIIVFKILKVTFLGTGTSHGVPFIGCECAVCTSDNPRDKRLRSSIHLDIDGKSIIIDAGPDFRQQVLRENIRQLDALVFTHEHKDHTAGLDEVRSFNHIQQQPIAVYCRSAVLDRLRKEYAYIFADHDYPGIPDIEVQLIENKPFTVAGIQLNPVEVMHHQMPVLGFRIGDFTYITDAKHIAEKEKQKIKGSSILVLNALQHEENIAHLTLNEALALVEELGVEQAYLTHISHRLGLHDVVSKNLPPHVALAYDGLQLKI